MNSTRCGPILAIDVRANRLGFAVFETAQKLRDFGAAWFESPSVARSRLRRLLVSFAPSHLVLRSTDARYPRNTHLRKAIRKIAIMEARRSGISVTSVSEREYHSFLRSHTNGDKYDLASCVATWFPEIAWRLPERPKFYDPEPRSLLYFDSIALGVAYACKALKSKVIQR